MLVLKSDYENFGMDEIGMSSATKPPPLTLETALETLGVKKAFTTLVRKKVDPHFLEYCLRDIATAPNKYGHKTDNKRRAAQLVRQARNLADQIECASKSSPIPIMGNYFEIQALPTLQHQLPGMLRAYASCWDHIHGWRVRISRGTGPESPRTDKIWALLDIVKQRTGRYHYQEIADLINAFDRAHHPNEAVRTLSVQDLTQLRIRGNRKMEKLKGSPLERKQLQAALNRRMKTISSKQSDSPLSEF
jgi:hypothetical protein